MLIGETRRVRPRGTSQHPSTPNPKPAKCGSSSTISRYSDAVQLLSVALKSKTLIRPVCNAGAMCTDCPPARVLVFWGQSLLFLLCSKRRGHAQVVKQIFDRKHAALLQRQPCSCLTVMQAIMRQTGLLPSIFRTCTDNPQAPASSIKHSSSRFLSAADRVRPAGDRARGAGAQEAAKSPLHRLAAEGWHSYPSQAYPSQAYPSQSGPF